MSSLRELAAAYLAYTADRDGYFCPAQDEQNLVRWRAVRPQPPHRVDAFRGYLASYLGGAGKVKVCRSILNYCAAATASRSAPADTAATRPTIGGTRPIPISPNRIRGPRSSS